MTVKPKITELLKRLNEGVFEKQEVFAMTLLTAIAGESIFLLGAPGVAKSLIARRLKYAFKEGTAFEYLMNRFSTPDEIFGPVSISKLKEDKYERNIKNYLPGASVIFLDEIWKAGPSIQNTLLTVLNEKIYRNGDHEIQLPLKAIISASNELPSKGEGLEALWDRFLVRQIVGCVNDIQNFNEMITKTGNANQSAIGEALKISDEDYKKWNKKIDEIIIPENVLNVISVIRNYIQLHNQLDDNKEKQIYISDRRWRKIVRLLRTSAFLNDRIAVDLMDCFLIKDCIWNEPEQIPAVNQFVKDAIEKHGYKVGIRLSDISDELKDFYDDVKTETSYLKDVNVEVPEVYGNNYYSIPNYHGAIIDINEYNNLNTKSETNINLSVYQSHSRSRTTVHCKVKLGSENHIQINGAEYSIKTIPGKRERKIH
jgi:MoxR-like ATPase